MTENPTVNKIKELAGAYGYSPFVIQQILVNFPSNYESVIRAFDKPAIETIRVNTLKSTPENVKKALEKKGFRVTPAKWIPYALNVEQHDSRVQIGATHETILGQYYMQSIASMIPVHLLYPQPGDSVLDMCAAPGSKTTQIGQLMNQQGTIVAIDNKKARIKSLSANIRRCGVYNAIIFPFDASHVKKALSTSFKPNKILLDAPCSSSGIIRNDPTQKRAKDDSMIRELSRIQKDLLRTGLELLDSGGFLMYSTCSFHYQENELVVSEVLKKFKDVEIMPPYEDIGLPAFNKIGKFEFGDEMLNARRLDPHEHDTDAFFMCLLKKN